MNRITDKDLQAIVARLNHMKGTPPEPYAKGADDRVRAQIGNYHLSHAYGGVCLHQMVTDTGGVRDVLMCGHVPKRELQTAMFAYIRGMEDSQS
jgi:hypothetical protein